MRHDFSDRIQVRYRHGDGQEFDTWVSGKEALQRLQSADVEDLLRRLGDLDHDELRSLAKKLPEAGKEHLRRSLRERLARSVDETLGDSIIADSLADLVDDAASDDHDTSGHDTSKQYWQTHLDDPRFRAMVLELAFIQLEGSLPENASADETDDWIAL